jgi:hypothetical protein
MLCAFAAINKKNLWICDDFEIDDEEKRKRSNTHTNTHAHMTSSS